MNAGEVAARALIHLRPVAERFELDPDALQIRYVANIGGFVNDSFTVTDGLRIVHLKVPRDEPDRRGLERWRSVCELLSERYRAPRMLGWLDELGAAVFEHVEAEPLESLGRDDIVDEVAGLLPGLHADVELARALAVAPRPIRDTFISYFVECCEQDLLELRQDDAMPPFVTAETVAWMAGEVASLRAACETSLAFDGTTDRVIHGDLWPGNVLVKPEAILIIDWDDMGAGDPVHDYALLTFSAHMNGRDPAVWLGDVDRHMRARYDLSIRATVLTGVVDSLADWAEARRAPSNQEALRAMREETHRTSLERYRALYG